MIVIRFELCALWSNLKLLLQARLYLPVVRITKHVLKFYFILTFSVTNMLSIRFSLSLPPTTSPPTHTHTHTATMHVASFSNVTIFFRSSEPMRPRMLATRCTVRVRPLASPLSSPSSQHQTTSTSMETKVSTVATTCWLLQDLHVFQGVPGGAFAPSWDWFAPPP